MPKIIKKYLKLLDPKRFLEYLVSGGAYFWFGYLMFFIADQTLGWSLWWAKLIANVSGWTLNYFLQKYWVFGDRASRKRHSPVTGRYITLVLFNFVLDYVIVAVLQKFGITPYIGQFVSAGFFTGWNYFWYRVWVFPGRKVNRRKRK